MAVDLDLDEELFRALGASLGAPLGPMSPWNGVDPEVTEDLRARLRRLGVDAGDPRGKELMVTVAALGAPTATTTVRIAGAGVLIDYMAYVSQDHGPIALYASAQDGGIHLEDPAPTDKFMQFVAGVVGRSPLRGLDLTLDLLIEDALVLAALVDLLRRHGLSEIANGGIAAMGSVSLDALKAALHEPPTGGFWLTDAIARACGSNSSIAIDGFQESLKRLTQRGQVETTGNDVLLSGSCAGLPEHFLSITSLIELQNSFDDGADPPRHLGFSCVQSGVTDLMTVEWLQQGIHLETASADAVVGYLDRFVRQPDISRSFASIPHPTEPIRWRPTHLVPARGLPTWKTPSASVAPETMLAGGLEVRIRRRADAWAEIEATNGWSGWVDAHSLEELTK